MVGSALRLWDNVIDAQVLYQEVMLATQAVTALLSAQKLLAAHQAEIGRYRLGHTKSLESANSCINWGVGAFGCSIILFIVGVGCAIFGIR